MSDFDVRGADQFYKLSKALKEAGRTGKGSLRNELHSTLQKAVKPLLPEGQKALASAMPGGELARRGGKVKQVVKVKTGRDPGISIGVQYGKRGTGMSAANARLVNRIGQIRHPLFGNKSRWFNTSVGGQGWFDDTYRENAPKVRPDMEAAMQAIVEKIVRAAR